jgi:hypothetical protein
VPCGKLYKYLLLGVASKTAEATTLGLCRPSFLTEIIQDVSSRGGVHKSGGRLT